MAKFLDIFQSYRLYWPLILFSITAASIFEITDLVVPYVVGQLLNLLNQQPLDEALQKAIAGVSALIDSIQASSAFIAIIGQIFQFFSGLHITNGLAPDVNVAVSVLTKAPPDWLLSLSVLLGLIFLVTIVKAAIQPWLTTWFDWDIALRSWRDNSQKALEKILTLPLGFYDENNAGRIIGKVTRAIDNLTWSYPEIGGRLLPKMFRLLGIFVFIWFIEWRLAIFFLISFVFILGFSLKNLQEVIKIDERLSTYMGNTESRTSEIITNIKTVKAFATESSELKRQQQRLNRESKVWVHRIHKGYVQLNAWQGTVIQFCIFIVLVWTLAATLAGQISLGHFITTLTICNLAYADLEPISQAAENFSRRYASMVGFQEFMEEQAGKDAANVLASPSTPSATTAYKFNGKIEFRQMSFGYDDSRLILQNINLLIEPYQTVALVGRSGGGKTTLVKLLFRYFEANQGYILIDGQDVRTLDITAYRRRLAIVHQEVDLFNGTLLDNLKYGNPNASWEQVQEACRIARVDEMIRLMPQGFSTIVGERGTRLSGGQRQRLGIARALLVDPDVLIFDEATSSLDSESERSIQLAMDSILGTRTTIIIAHRLSTVRDADKIVVLDGGQIVEVGSHAELLKREGIYRHLHLLQEAGGKEGDVLVVP